jgi:hypothetical protein
VQGLIDEMLIEAQDWWREEAVPDDARRLAVALDMRYVSQNYELQVPSAVAGCDPRLPDAEKLRQLFFAAHEKAYGFFNEEDPVDVVAVRLTANGRLPSPSAPTVPDGASRDAPPRERRQVWFTGSEPHDTPVYDRADLAPGTRMPSATVRWNWQAASSARGLVSTPSICCRPCRSWRPRTPGGLRGAPQQLSSARTTRGARARGAVASRVSLHEGISRCNCFRPPFSRFPAWLPRWLA